ncbi:MAG: flagellar export chaperone FliS [Bacillaceae bacterium]|nr:flagellar export chaperone FliS [Bacillaceae bacterium]
MAATNPYATYKQKAMNTTSPGELTLMLYNGCLKFIKRAEQAIENKNIEGQNLNLIKAQDIIRELMVTLKTDSEVGQNMLRVYDFILSRLVDANVNGDLKALKEAEEFVTEFRDTWKEVLIIDRKARHGEGGQA